MTDTPTLILRALTRYRQFWISGRFARYFADPQETTIIHGISPIGGWQIVLGGTSLGEELGEIEFPAEWKRFLQTKQCPKYLKKITKVSVTAYYPKLSLPEEPHWVTFEPEDGIIKREECKV